MSIKTYAKRNYYKILLYFTYLVLLTEVFYTYCGKMNRNDK